MSSKMVQQHKAWQERNPLRIWRKRNDCTLQAAASLLGVNAKSIQLWESGSTQPIERNIELIATLLKLRPATLAKKWAVWSASAPGVRSAR